jgi:hypothetical protein
MNLVGAAAGRPHAGPAEATAATRRTEDEQFAPALWLALVNSQVQMLASPRDALLGGGGEAEGRGDAPGTGGGGRAARDSIGDCGTASGARDGRTDPSRETDRNGAGSEKADGSRAASGAGSGRDEGATPDASRDPAKHTAGDEQPASSIARLRGQAAIGSFAARLAANAAATAAAAAAPTATATAGLSPAPLSVSTAPGPAAAARTVPAGLNAPGAAVARAQTAANAGGSRPSTLVVPFEDDGGNAGRIRLTLRGDALQATILAANRETAQRLSSSLGELQQALGERGFSGARLTVRQAGGEDAADTRSTGGGGQEDADTPQRHSGDRRGAQTRHWKGGRF